MVPDFFNPADFSTGKFSPQFFDTFDNNNVETREYAAGMKVLTAMEPFQRARLPLFVGASAIYRQLVTSEIQTVLGMPSMDKEILITKRSIVLCAWKHGYLMDQNIFETGPLNLDGVDLSDMSLAGLNLTNASLEDTNFSYPAQTSSDILKARVFGFADPELYEPVDPDKWIFSKEFYCLFSCEKTNSMEQQLGMVVIQGMRVYQTAQLPIYRGACAEYSNLVIDAIMQVYHSPETDDETAFIKRIIYTSAYTHWGTEFLKCVERSNSTCPLVVYGSLERVLIGSSFGTYAQVFLESMSYTERARMPLFHGAPPVYRRLVSEAIKRVLASNEIDHETLRTKRHIIICAIRHRYLHKSEFFGTQPNFDSVNFNGLKLRGLNLSKASLKRANFRNADLTRVRLPKMSKFDAVFFGAKLNRSNLTDMVTQGESLDLSGADLSNETFCTQNFQGIILHGANFSGSDLSRCSLKDVNIEGADLTMTFFFHSDLRGTRLAGAKLRGARFIGSNFAASDYSGIDFSGTDLTDAFFLNAQLRYANFEGILLRGTIFKDSDLTGANFCNATFKGTNIENATLTDIRTNKPELTLAIENEQARRSAMQARETSHREDLEQTRAVRSMPDPDPSIPPDLSQTEAARPPTLIVAQRIATEHNSQPRGSGWFSWFSGLSSSVGNFFNGLFVRFKRFCGLASD